MIIPIGDKDIRETKRLSGKNVLEIVKYIAKIADEKNASYIKILDTSSRLIITDYFVIVGARNKRLTRRIEEEVRASLEEINLRPISTCGLREGNWILMDYDDFVVHIFTDEYRLYYDLERLWKDSMTIYWN